MVTFLLIAGLVLLFIALWLLFTPIIIEGDTRVPYLRFRWRGIGKAEITYQENWLLKWRLLFFGRTIDLEKSSAKRISKKTVSHQKKKKMKAGTMLRKMVRIIKTFRVDHWQLALDTGDNTLTAQLYPVNFMPGMKGHLEVNFNGVNYFRFRIRNRAWKILIAYLKK